MIKIGLVCVSLIMFCTVVNAKNNEIYYGVNVANTIPNISGYNSGTNQTYSFEDVTSIGVIIGYSIDKNLIIEGEAKTNIDPGEISSLGNDKQNEWDISTLSVYGLYKGNGKTHVRLKAGLTYASIKSPSAFSLNAWTPDESSTKLSYGIGMGFDTSSGKEFVIEWTQLSDDITTITFGINF